MRLQYKKTDDGYILEGPILEIGQTVYLIRPSQAIVVPTTVVELEDIYSLDGKTVWHYRYDDGSTRCVKNTGKRGKDGWNIYEEIDCKEIEGLPLRNQLAWVDEPVGHSIQVGDEIFLSLNEALKHIRPSNKRHLKRRLIASRKSVQKFIAHTWKMNSEKHPGFQRLPEKRVYAKRG